MILDDEETRQKILKELRGALEKNSTETMRIKAANEIREGLERMSEHELERDVKNVTKVTTTIFKSKSH